MSTLPFVDAATLDELVPPAAAVAALEQTLRREPPAAPLRTHLDAPSGDLLVMPYASKIGVGVKLVGVCPGNAERGLPLIHGLYVAFDPETMAPRALIDGAALTTARTAAVSALASKLLARADSRQLVLFGAGAQAHGHLHALRAVLPLEEVTVVSRSPAPAEALVDVARGLGLSARTASPAAVASADIVCTCTTSPTPVFDGDLLPAGVHVNAVGAFRPDQRELDDTTLRRGRLVVDTAQGAFAEAGELVLGLASGALREQDVEGELADVVRGRVRRADDAEITVFKSVGDALQDAAVAAAVVAALTGTER